MDLNNKKVLLMGLGVLGGGVATANWLLKQGALLTITDLKDREYLKDSIEKLKNLDIKFVLGRHDEKDFLETDILIINPDVPATNPLVEIAKRAGKQIENELTLFLKYATCKSIIGITGTRGKTTTTNWIGSILKQAGRDVVVLGNDPEKPFLSEINNCTKETIAIIEAPSYQLEIMGESGLAPHIALITNLYQDHLNRHKTMEGYALAKANIFKNQKEGDFLLLNKNNDWTEFFLDLRPQSKVVFISSENLPEFDEDKFAYKYGKHNLQNFTAAATACSVVGLTGEEIIKSISNLPQIKWREELVYEKGNLKIYNDTAATSPEATISAIERFGKNKLVLITGGTDRELDFKEWGKMVRDRIKPNNLILLSGSATEKMKKELVGWETEEHDNLENCLKSALSKIEESTKTNIVFSPGSKSFEKFKNEFDRGEKFNLVIKGLLS